MAQLIDFPIHANLTQINDDSMNTFSHTLRQGVRAFTAAYRNMSVRIEPLTAQDVPEKCQIMAKALANHPRMPMMFPDQGPAYYSYKKSSDIDDLSDPTARLLKAVDIETGQMLGSADWTMALDEKANAEKKPTSPDTPPPSNWPPQANWQMRLFYKINGERLIKQYLGTSPYISMNARHSYDNTDW